MNSSRQELQEHLLLELSQVLTVSECECFHKLIQEMSDYDFYQLIAEARARYGECTTKEYMNLKKQCMQVRNISPEESAQNTIPIRFLPEEENSELLKRIHASSPSDTIRLDPASDEELTGIWKDAAKKIDPQVRGFIPSDIFFAQTIPLQDCKISVDERGSVPNVNLIDWRVVVYPNYADLLARATDESVIEVGAVIWKMHSASVICSIYVTPGFDSLMFGRFGYEKMPSEMQRYIEQQIPLSLFKGMANAFLKTWYGIQIALLHPIVKSVFENPYLRRCSDFSNARKKRKRRVKYMKVHTVRSGEVERLLNEKDEYGLTRRTLVWYVLGHWRQQGEKKVFVRPYWKGPLREIRMNLDEREREVAMNEVEVETA